MRVFLLLFLLSPGLGAVQEADRTCRSFHTCLSIGDCPAIKEKHDDFKRCGNRQSGTCGNLQRELREAVCNKEEKAVCCPDVCMARSECRYADEKIELYKQLKEQNNRKAKEILNELKDRVCDQKKRFMWCPLAPTNRPAFITTRKQGGSSRPDYLPRFGECGFPVHPKQIVGGTDTQPGEFPFAALLGFVEKEFVAWSAGRQIFRDKMNWVCGGTLINHWYVLTAAHCQGKSPESTISRVRLGEWSVESYGKETETEELPDEQDFTITKNDFKVHEGFKKEFVGKIFNIVNDIALVKLPRPAKINAGVQVTCLPFNFEEFKNYLKIGDVDSGIEGKKSTVIGWGKTDADQLSTKNGVGSKQLQKLEVPILNQNQCNSYFSTLENSQLCAGGEKRKDSCRGDSGGGLFIQDTKDKEEPWYLIGIVSFGSRECGNGRPGIYTRVSSFIPWIVKNLK